MEPNFKLEKDKKTGMITVYTILADGSKYFWFEIHERYTRELNDWLNEKTQNHTGIH